MNCVSSKGHFKPQNGSDHDQKKDAIADLGNSMGCLPTRGAPPAIKVRKPKELAQSRGDWETLTSKRSGCLDDSWTREGAFMEKLVMS